MIILRPLIGQPSFTTKLFFLAAVAATAAGRDKKKLKRFHFKFVSVLLSASVERVGVSLMWDFSYNFHNKIPKFNQFLWWHWLKIWSMDCFGQHVYICKEFFDTIIFFLIISIIRFQSLINLFDGTNCLNHNLEFLL